MEDIERINRFKEIPQDGPFSDLMWSDPDPAIKGFGRSERGAGYTFGSDVVE